MDHREYLIGELSELVTRAETLTGVLHAQGHISTRMTVRLRRSVSSLRTI